MPSVQPVAAPRNMCRNGDGAIIRRPTAKSTAPHPRTEAPCDQVALAAGKRAWQPYPPTVFAKALTFLQTSMRASKPSVLPAEGALLLRVAPRLLFAGPRRPVQRGQPRAR